MNQPEALPPAIAGRSWGGPVLGLAISALLLWWAMRGVDFAAAWAAARSASPTLLLLAVALATSTFVLRVPRWQHLLRTDAGARLGTGPAWHAIAIGFMANNVLPFRAGELLRAWAVTRLAPVRFTSAFSSVAVERVFDGLIVTALLALSLLSPTVPPEARIGGTLVSDLATRAGLLFVLLLLAASMMVAMPARAERILRRLVPWPALAERLVGILQGAAAGLGALRSPGRLVLVVLWSAVVWLANAAAMWLAAFAFGMDLGFSAMLLLQGVLVFGVAVPSTPGYVGVFQFIIVLVLGVLGVNRDLAFAYAVTYHVTTWIPITVLGLVSVARTPISFADLRPRRA